MSSLIASISLSGALLALTISVVALVLHWVKRHSTPETDRIDARISSLSVQHLDLLDKVEHWRRRDNVRNARAGAEAKRDAAEQGAAADLDPKAVLRAKALAAGLGVVNR